jgi:hypothetical protein
MIMMRICANMTEKHGDTRAFLHLAHDTWLRYQDSASALEPLPSTAL